MNCYRPAGFLKQLKQFGASLKHRSDVGASPWLGRRRKNASAGFATERAMDLLNSTYNKLERLAVSADQWLTGALRQWDSWSTTFKLAALDERQLKDIGLSRKATGGVARDDAEQTGHAEDRNRQAAGAA
jgi:uncharacterized protein YjiS (DUF1127 family)